MSDNYIYINDLCDDVITGKTPSTNVSKYWNGDIPFITPTDINGFDMRYIDKTIRTITNNAIDDNQAKLIPKNSICVTCIGSTIGKICIPSKVSVTNQQINTMVLKKEYDYRYIYYLLRYFLPYIRLIGSGTGSGKDILNATRFKKIKLPIVDDKEKRKKIGDFLSKYDDYIECNKKNIFNLEQMIEKIYIEWFINCRVKDTKLKKEKTVKPYGWIIGNDNEMKIPNNWHIGKLEELGKFVRGKNITAEKMIEGNIPVISAGINPSGYHNEYNVEGKSLTMSASGANAGYLKYNLDNIWAADCSYYQNDENIWFVYSSLKFVEKAINNLQVGAAQPHVYPKNINKINIIIPDKELIKEYNALVSPLFDEIKILLKKNEVLIRERELLLPKLISSKLIID